MLLQSRGRHAKVTAVLNKKGGVGKTHTIWLCTGGCIDKGESMIALDLDTQGNLSTSLLPTPDSNPGMDELFRAEAATDVTTLIRHSKFDNIDVIPPGPNLGQYDLSTTEDWERYDLHFCLTDAVNQLSRLYDHILIDCPPRLSLVSYASLCCSDFIIIPLEAADWGAQGVTQINAAIEHVRKHYNPKLTVLGYLVNKYKCMRIYQRTYLKELRKTFGPHVFDTVIRDLAEYERSVTDGIPVIQNAPRTQEADDARQLFSEILTRATRKAIKGRAKSC